VTAAPTTAPDSAGVSPAPNEEPKNAVIEEQPEESAKPEESTEPEQSAVTEQSEEIQGIVEFPADAPPETEEESGRSSVIWAVVAVDVILLILIGGYFWRKKVLK
jgi:hypothetical protein